MQVIDHPPPHQPVVAAHDVAEEIDAIADRAKALARGVEFQAQVFAEIGGDLFPPVQQLLLLRGQQHEVVAVAQVVATFQLMLDELIQAVEVDVGEELAVEVADGQSWVQSWNTSKRVSQSTSSSWIFGASSAKRMSWSMLMK